MPNSPALEPWRGVEPRHLATFAAVADAGSFRTAATRLGYVQSAVSQQIAHLERALGVRLIERGHGHRDLELTPAGRRLLVHARRIVDQVRAACADVSYLSGARPIRVAVDSAATSLLSVLALNLPNDVGMAVSEVSGPAVAELVTSGAADVGVGSFVELPPGLSRRVVGADRWVLVVPENAAPTVERVPSSLLTFRGSTLIEDRSHPLPLEASRLNPDRVIGCDRLRVALDLVRAGAGRAILPAVGVPDGEPGVRLIELGERMPPRELSLIWLQARRLPGELVQLASNELRGTQHAFAAPETAAA